jgi:ABC-2 type transport system permease protein
MRKLFIADLKLLFRNRQLLFWSLAFPLIFTVIFGFFFGQGAGGGGTVGLVNKADSEIATDLARVMRESDLFTVKAVASQEEAEELLKDNKLQTIVVIPAEFGGSDPAAPKTVTVIYDPAATQGYGIVTGFLESYMTRVNYRIQNAQPIYGVDHRKTTMASFSYFDFVLVGLIGMALMNSSIQGLAISMAKYREDKILKRITTTPLPTWKFIAAEVLSRLVLNFLQVGLIILVGVQFFNGSVHGNLGMIFALSLLGAVLFQLIGFGVATAVKTTQAAEGMATAVTIPMMFLAGVFFPIDQLPAWLFSVVQYLPLAPLLRMLRSVALEGASPLANPANMGIVLGWVAAMLAIAILRFRLADE